MKKQINKYIDSSYLANKFLFFGFISISIGLFFSKAMMSIGFAVCLLACLIIFFKIKRPLTTIPKESYLLTILFLFSFISFFWTHNSQVWTEKIVLKLPLLLFPIFAIGAQKLSPKQILSIIWVYIFSCIVTGGISMGNYLVHFEAINQSILHSKAIPILFEKLSHIYYSVLLAISIGLTSYLYWIKKELKKISYVLITLCVIQLIFLHTIASRTGVFAFYFGLSASLFYVAVKHKLYKPIVLSGILFLLLIYLSVNYIPSWKNRIENTQVDLEKLSNKEDINHYSLSMRFEALRIASLIITKYPILGVGEGDLQEDMNKEYLEQHSILEGENQKLPHNQFVQTASTTGVLSSIFLFVFFVFHLINGYKKNKVLTVFSICTLFFAFQFESFLERQTGLYLFFLLISLLPMIPTLVFTNNRHLST